MAASTMTTAEATAPTKEENAARVWSMASTAMWWRRRTVARITLLLVVVVTEIEAGGGEEEAGGSIVPQARGHNLQFLVVQAGIEVRSCVGPLRPVVAITQNAEEITT
jgi:hypothetical protein